MAYEVIPNPSYTYGRGGQSTGKVVADTEQEALEWRERYLGMYHPMGYGTVVSEPTQNEDGKWVCTYKRWNSCS